MLGGPTPLHGHKHSLEHGIILESDSTLFVGIRAAGLDSVGSWLGLVDRASLFKFDVAYPSGGMMYLDVAGRSDVIKHGEGSDAGKWNALCFASPRLSGAYGAGV
eukprot:gene18387-biopygen11455